MGAGTDQTRTGGTLALLAGSHCFSPVETPPNHSTSEPVGLGGVVDVVTLAHWVVMVDHPPAPPAHWCNHLDLSGVQSLRCHGK